MSIATLPSRERASSARRLSPMRAGMLAETLLAPKSGVNIVQFVIHYEERVDAATLRRAWEHAAESFPVFRTEFSWRDGTPSQGVLPHVELPWEEIAAGAPDASGEEAFRTWLKTDRERGVALDQAPLMRLTLIRMPDRDRLVWTFHHILLDGGSFPIVLQGVEQTYRALRQGQLAHSLESPDYEQFLDWLETRDDQSDKIFWEGYLRGIQAATPLFEARERPDESVVHASMSIEHKLSLESSRALSELARRCDATLGTIVQGAWGLLACRQHGASEALFGVTRSGRHFSTGAENIVGLLINTVPVRVKAAPESTLTDFLRALREDTLRIRKHEATSLIDIQSVSEIPRGEPLFNSLVIFEGESLEQRLSALDQIWKSRNIEVIEQSSFPLVLTVQVDGGLSLELTYDPAIFAADTIERSLRQFATLLESMGKAPDARVADLAWVPRREMERVEAVNAQVLLDGEHDTVVSLFEKCVRRAPDAEAVVAPDGRLTYAELDRRANCLANYLIERGVRRGDAVAIVLERTTSLIVAILGVLKAGGAYLPIDTFYPKERIQAVADASQFNLMLTLSRLKNSLPRTDASLVFLDVLDAEISTRSAAAPDVAISADDPAYMIFTSGTTGKPKGVRTVHGNVTSMYRAWEDAYRLDEKRAHLQLASPSFDVFSGELTRALCSGLKLVMCPYEYALKPNKLFELIRDERVDVAEFVPLSLRSLVDYLERTSQKLDTMRLLAAGADVWYVHEFERVRRFLPDGARLVNSYGISETTIDSTYFEGDVSHLPQSAVIPIGRPFANTSIYVLDERGQRLPIGVVGEIYIGGHGVTPGYVNDPERTRERFLRDPFREGAGALMYKSGDLGRLRSDGSVELVGRADHQVKVRGFRIELGEVETALASHPDVAQAVVVAQARGVGEKRLVGYFVPKDGKSVDVRRLRAHIGDKLPYYMVPAALVRLDEIPKSPNGKVERKALPAPEEMDAGVERAYEAPRDQLEARLCQLWEEVLGVPRVGVSDDFFEIGGHSLLAVSLFAKIESQIGQELPITALFEGRTVARMADGLRRGKRDWSNVVELGGDGPEPPLFWVHTLGGGGGGGLFRYEQLAQRLDLARKSYGIRAPAEPFNRIDVMAEAYVEEIRRVQPKGPYYLLGYCFGGIVAYEIAEKLYARGERVAFLGLIEAPAQVEPPSPWEAPGAFLKNALDFVRAFMAWPGEKQRIWARRQLRVLRHRILEPNEAVYTLGDFLDTRETTGDYRRYVEAHWDALSHYEPKPHPVRATVFRVRGQDLRSFERTLGWDQLCEEGVDVEFLTGRHGEIFDGAHFEHLSSHLKRHIQRATRPLPVSDAARAETTRG